MSGLRLLVLVLVAVAIPLSTDAQIVCTDFLNCSFETGLTSWLVLDHPAPFSPLTVSPAGQSTGFGFFATLPPDGMQSVWHGFDGGTPGTIQLFQEVLIPTGLPATLLQFYYRAGWDMLTFGGSTQARTFEVHVEPMGGGAPLQTTTILTAPPATQNLDTGGEFATVDLAPFAGQTVRVKFFWNVPEPFTGPGMFELDAVEIVSSLSFQEAVSNVACTDNVGLDSITVTWDLPATGVPGDTYNVYSENGGILNLEGTVTYPANTLTYNYAPGSSGLFETCVEASGANGLSIQRCCDVLVGAAGNDECVNATPVNEGSFPFDTTVATQSTPVQSCGLSAPDVWLAYTATCDGIAVAETTGFNPGDDTIIEVLDACGGLVIGCDDDLGVGFLSRLQFNCIAGTTYLLRVSGWNAGTGTGTIDISCFVPTPEIDPVTCQDGIDNDLNGLTDCAEPSCQALGLAFCDESVNCADGIDNDADGLIDCADFDCAGIGVCPPAAVNDDCTTAISIACGDVVVGDTTLAFPETLGTCGTTDGTGGGLWYVFTGNGDQVTLSTCSLTVQYDTKIRVWEEPCGGLVCVDGNDDNCAGGSSGLLSTVAFLTTPGVNYYVLVHGFSTSVGTFEMTVTCVVPGIEDCTNGIDDDLDGLIDCADTVDCGALPQCIEVCDDGLDNDADGLIDCADTVDCPTGVAPCIPPTNDECATAIAITDGDTSFDTTLLTASLPAATCGTGTPPDQWFLYTATCDGFATAEITSFIGGGGGADSTLQVESGDCLGTVIGCDDDGGVGLLSILTFPVTSGTTYAIRVSGWGTGATATGSGVLNMSCLVPSPEICDNGIDDDFDGLIDCADTVDCPFGTPPCIPPTNDICTTAIPINCGDIVTGDTTFAAPETLGVCGTTDGTGGAVWYSFVGNGDVVTLTTCSLTPQLDTKIRVWEGDCATLTCVDGNDDSCTGGSSIFLSTVTFSTSVGTDYYIMVHGFATSAGFYELSVICNTPGVEDCSNGIDDDLDSLVDCFDEDCNCDAACAAAPGVPVGGLTASSDCSSGDVTLSFNGTYDSYDIARDGVIIASGITATSYTDIAIGPGTFVYEVIGSCGTGQIGAPAEVTVIVVSYGGEQDLIIDGDGAAGAIDSVMALSTELSALGRSFSVFPGQLGDYPCGMQPFEIVWVMNGTFPADTGDLTPASGTDMRAYHDAGTGLYLESGDNWGFTHVFTDFDTIDGVAATGTADGDDTFTAMDGSDTGFGLDRSADIGTVYNQDQPTGNDWTDQLALQVGDDPDVLSAQLWAVAGGAYITGIASTPAADPARGNVIVQSWEFGGYGGDQNLLATDYVNFLGGNVTPPGTGFLRADVNNDGLCNIGDAIFLLGSLFPPAGGMANVITCADAADSNDDGLVNIGDAIFKLGALFPPLGSPPNMIPAPNGPCGPDPTADMLDCAMYNGPC